MSEQTFMQLGRRYDMVIGYSEAACHLRVAGRPMLVEITSGPHPMAQLFTQEGTPYSFPITLGEAGIYTDAAGRPYAYDAHEVISR